ncbi:recombinase family protein [Streptomyces sp. BH104]|uniref:recombinase family protein n=1 Tax=Streptomyces sp. BH104 TaxID=3410407 RepID=UPI003BB6C4C7
MPLDSVVRDGFDSARAAVVSGAVRTLIVWKLDRLSRKGISEIGPLLDEFDQVEGRLISVLDGLDSTSPGARLAISSLSEWARQEAETQGQRIQHAKRFLRRQGRWIGGQPPYGLRVDVEGSGIRRAVAPDPDGLGRSEESPQVHGCGEAVSRYADGFPGGRGGRHRHRGRAGRDRGCSRVEDACKG